MFTPLKTAALAGLATLPAAAFAAFATGDTVGTSEAEIRAALESEGYTVLEFEIEEDEIEVEALYEGKRIEIELAKDTGQILEIEDEDDEDDD